MLFFFAQIQLLEVLNSPIRKNVFTLDLQYFLSLKGMFRYEFNHSLHSLKWNNGENGKIYNE